MKLQLIAMDLDGTLLNDEKRISDRTKRILMEAQKQGIRLALASARPSTGLNRECEALDMKNYGGILMSYNGGRIIDAATGGILFETTMDLNTTKSVLRKLEALPVTPILDDGKIFYVESKDGYKVDYECRNNNMVCQEVGNLADFLHFPVVKILMSLDPQSLPQVQKTIAAFLPEDLTVVQTAAFYLEIIPRSIHKGQGIRDICRTLNIPKEAVIAFGDAENDIPMLREAGIGVAMGNAQSSVKAVADKVTLSNNEDGLAAALEGYF